LLTPVPTLAVNYLIFHSFVFNDTMLYYTLIPDLCTHAGYIPADAA
jgi:hypothetical protein